jgi:uncharacterized protein DUF6059
VRLQRASSGGAHDRPMARLVKVWTVLRYAGRGLVANGLAMSGVVPPPELRALWTPYVPVPYRPSIPVGHPERLSPETSLTDAERPLWTQLAGPRRPGRDQWRRRVSDGDSPYRAR